MTGSQADGRSAKRMALITGQGVTEAVAVLAEVEGAAEVDARTAFLGRPV